MKKIKILVVEDNPDFATAISGILEKAGYQVFLLMDYRPAIYKKALKFKPDIALLDHELIPGFTGKSVAEDLKISKDRLISISREDSGKSYCGDHFWGKDQLDKRVMEVGKVKEYRKILLTTVSKVAKLIQ